VSLEVDTHDCGPICSIVVVEHNFDLVKAADQVIDSYSEGAPEHTVQGKESRTEQCWKEMCNFD